jgi:hypothetical protein
MSKGERAFREGGHGIDNPQPGAGTLTQRHGKSIENNRAKSRVAAVGRRYSSVNLKRAGLGDHTEHCLQVFDGRWCRA